MRDTGRAERVSCSRDIPTEYRSRIEQELWKDERVLWCEMPVPRLLSAAGVLGFLSGGFVTFLATVSLADAVRKLPEGLQAGAIAPALFSLLMLLTGLHLLCSPWRACNVARRTVYAITNFRAVIFEADAVNLQILLQVFGGRSAAAAQGIMGELGMLEAPDRPGTRVFRRGWPRKIRSYPHVLMRRIFFRTRRGGTGDVVFDLQSLRGHHGDKFWSERGFKNVRNPEEVWSRLNSLAKQAKALQADAEAEPVAL